MTHSSEFIRRSGLSEFIRYYLPNTQSSYLHRCKNRRRSGFVQVSSAPIFTGNGKCALTI